MAIKQANLLGLSYWFAARDNRIAVGAPSSQAGANAIGVLNDARLLLPFWLIGQDFGGQFSICSAFRLDGMESPETHHMKQELYHVINKIDMKYISGLQDQDRMVSVYGMDAVANIMRDLKGAVDNHTIKLAEAPIAAEDTNVDAPGDPKAVGPKENAQPRKAPKKVKFAAKAVKKEKIDKEDTKSAWYFAGFTALAYLIFRRS